MRWSPVRAIHHTVTTGRLRSRLPVSLANAFTTAAAHRSVDPQVSGLPERQSGRALGFDFDVDRDDPMPRSLL
jgi:hypothetical protein